MATKKQNKSINYLRQLTPEEMTLKQRVELLEANVKILQDWMIQERYGKAGVVKESKNGTHNYTFKIPSIPDPVLPVEDGSDCPECGHVDKLLVSLVI